MLLRVYSLMAREMVSFVEIVYGKDGVYTNDSVGSDVSVCIGNICCVLIHVCHWTLLALF